MSKMGKFSQCNVSSFLLLLIRDVVRNKDIYCILKIQDTSTSLYIVDICTYDKNRISFVLIGYKK